LYNNCDDGILFKSVFYRKCDAIQCLVSLSGLCSILVCIFVILLLCVLLFRVSVSVCLSVLLPVSANQDVHKTVV